MTGTRWPTVIFLVAALVVIVVLVSRYAFSGPTFRADEHATYDECVRNIPREWGVGSLEHTRAETACQHVHLRGVPTR